MNRPVRIKKPTLRRRREGGTRRDHGAQHRPPAAGRPPSTSAKSFLNLPSVLTAGSVAAGFLAVVLAGRDELGWAVGMIGVAAVIDSVDGALARRLDCCSEFGSRLDSLADMVSFGVAPALLLHVGVLHAYPGFGEAACVAFVVAGAWRLARFPLVEDPNRFLGLPIPAAGVIACALAVLAPPAGFVLGLTATMALLMISEVPFPTLRTLWRLARSRGRQIDLEPAADPLAAEVQTAADSRFVISPPRRG